MSLPDRYCRDCRWRLGRFCRRPLGYRPTPDPVTGVRPPSYADLCCRWDRASRERADCGPGGQWWTPPAWHQPVRWLRWRLDGRPGLTP